MFGSRAAGGLSLAAACGSLTDNILKVYLVLILSASCEMVQNVKGEGDLS